MNVDHQIFTAQGRLVPMDYEILLPPCLDPELDDPAQSRSRPISTHATRRINVAWVSETDDLLPYLATASVYQSFLQARGDQLHRWAEASGFPAGLAGDLARLIRRNADRLLGDLRTLIRCNGTVYLSGNETAEDGTRQFGKVLPIRKWRVE
jgi:hypothetical protein